MAPREDQRSRPGERTKPQYRWFVYWIAYAAFGFLLFWRHGVSADEGLTLTAAWNVSRGLVPYRDFFEFYTPGSFYLLGALFWMFGSHYAVALTASLVTLLLGGYGLWISSRGFLTGWPRFLVPFLWLVISAYYPLINHNTLSLIAVVWAWVVLQEAQRRGSPRWYVVAGAAAGGVVWLLQTKGAVLIAAAVVVTLLCYRSHARHLLWYLAGIALSLAPFLTWPLPMLWSTLVWFPLQNYHVAGIGKFFFLLAIAVHGALGVLLWQQRAPRQALGLWWLGIFLLLSAGNLPDIHHVAANAFPIVPLTLWAAARLPWPNFKNVSWWVLTVLPTALLTAFAVIPLASLPVDLYRQAADPVRWLTLGSLELDPIVAEIRRRVPADGYLYAGPFLPNLYFESQRKNPTRFSHLLTALHPPEFFTAARRQLEANPPALVILNYQMVEKYDYRTDNPVDEYFQTHYRVFDRRGPVILKEPIRR